MTTLETGDADGAIVGRNDSSSAADKPKMVPGFMDENSSFKSRAMQFGELITCFRALGFLRLSNHNSLAY